MPNGSAPCAHCGALTTLRGRTWLRGAPGYPGRQSFCLICAEALREGRVPVAQPPTTADPYRPTTRRCQMCRGRFAIEDVHLIRRENVSRWLCDTCGVTFVAVAAERSAREAIPVTPKPACLPGGAHHWIVTSLRGGAEQHDCQRCGARWTAPLARDERVYGRADAAMKVTG